jgi:CDP-glucose 4,6-dehydratase
MKKNKDIFKNKKIIVTGHTGFKGSWLTAWLVLLGAKVTGLSNKVPTNPSHFKTLKIKNKIKNIKVDVRDLKKIKKIFLSTKPDFVFHLAAQALVKNSYENPINTIETNTIGTLNVLESLRALKNRCIAVIITSDKVYKNLEIKRGYLENDILGGKDPYSSSKASAELIIKSYIDSFFPKKKTNVFIGIARAGNVIGGGDWSKDRLIPDCVKSWSKKRKVILRNPQSTRPWQHVLEAIWGYLLLAENIKINKKLHGESFNFGPNNNSSQNVLKVVKTMKKYWGQISWKIIKNKKKKFYESNLLKLNSNKAKKYLGWSCKMSFSQTIQMVAEWYKNFYDNKKNSFNFSYNQINEYEKIIDKKK